jgi:hypothetical protein
MEERGQQHTEDQAEPELLYHYTTLDGLLGILDKGEVWATGIRYLNDTFEYKAAPSAAVDISMADSQYGENASGFDNLNSLFRYSAAHAESVFVASFSAEPSGDDLSQWRAYSGEHSGVCLGFSSKYLNMVGKRFVRENSSQGWIGNDNDEDPLVRCEYCQDPTTHGDDKTIQDRVRKVMAIEDSRKKVLTFARYAASLKHQKFRAEHEWRMVLVFGGQQVPDSVGFRRTRSFVAPYARIHLTWLDQPIVIDRVVIGPTPHRDEAKSSIEMLLKRYHLKYKEVVSSEVPYRNWYACFRGTLRAGRGAGRSLPEGRLKRVLRERKVRTPQGSVPDNVRDAGVKARGRQVPQKTYRRDKFSPFPQSEGPGAPESR